MIHLLALQKHKIIVINLVAHQIKPNHAGTIDCLYNNVTFSSRLNLWLFIDFIRCYLVRFQDSY